MIGEYRFFQDFFDGQIIKKESDEFKVFKLILFLIMSVACLILVLFNLSNPLGLILLLLGMVWNLYMGLGKWPSLIFSVLVSISYFYFCARLGLYANGLVYLGCYIPFQLIATVKDYEEGDFIQIKKKMTDYNKILFMIFFMVETTILCLFNYGLDSEFALIDGIVAGSLLASAVLRNERYVEYYVFRVFALVGSLALWIRMAISFGTYETIAVILMYATYLIFDTVNFFVQKKTYLNQEMVADEEFKKLEEEKVVKEKVGAYKKLKQSEKKNG